MRGVPSGPLRQDRLHGFNTLQDVATDVADNLPLTPANRISLSTMPFASMTSEDVAAFYSLLDE